MLYQYKTAVSWSRQHTLALQISGSVGQSSVKAACNQRAILHLFAHFTGRSLAARAPSSVSCRALPSSARAGQPVFAPDHGHRHYRRPDNAHRCFHFRRS